MSVALRRLNQVNQFCINYLVYPLVFSSVMACGILAARYLYAHSADFRFLLWNLFLAWIPYLCSLIVDLLHRQYPRRWWYLILPSVLWLVFLPNAPYIITDIGHLDERIPIPIWYDLGLLVTFAWTGCFLAVVSLNTMQRLVTEYFGRIISWLFVFGTIGLSGLGIYAGRMLRWNSWDIFRNPQSILDDLVARFAHPIQNPGAIGFTLLFAAFMLICYLTFSSIEHRRWTPPSD